MQTKINSTNKSNKNNNYNNNDNDQNNKRKKLEAAAYRPLVNCNGLPKI